MKISQQLIKKITAIVIGLIVFFLLVYFGFRILGSRAADMEPREVLITEITQNSAVISWTTGIETQGVIEYGTSATALNFFAPETQSSKNHEVTLTLLSPSTTYYFQIRVGDKKYDNGGVPWTFTTKGASVSNPITTSTPTGVALTSAPTQTPTPIQVLDVGKSGNKSPTLPPCDETECEKIKLKLGKGCTTQDYFRCIRKLTTTPTATITPTSTPSATPTP